MEDFIGRMLDAKSNGCGEFYMVDSDGERSNFGESLLRELMSNSDDIGASREGNLIILQEQLDMMSTTKLSGLPTRVQRLIFH